MANSFLLAKVHTLSTMARTMFASPKPSILAPKLATAHHLKGLNPAFAVMAGLGISRQSCLKGSGLALGDIDRDDIEFHPEQEFHIYRNLLELSQDPLLGLKLGEAFPLESYGLLGYAMLSASTIGEAVKTAQEFGALTFSHFKILMLENKDRAGLGFEAAHGIPDDLLALYCDRDIQASLKVNSLFSPGSVVPVSISMMHEQLEHRDVYRAHWQCEIEFGAWRNESWFEKHILESPMPRVDSDTSKLCRQQCSLLLQKLSQQGRFSDKVRQRLVAQPGQLPSLDAVAKELACSSRTLRRKLALEGCNYQTLLNEIRQQLAQYYLATGLSVERVSELLAYSEVSNFSHAFKRWQGISPRDYQIQRINR